MFNYSHFTIWLTLIHLLYSIIVTRIFSYHSRFYSRSWKIIFSWIAGPSQKIESIFIFLSFLSPEVLTQFFRCLSRGFYIKLVFTLRIEYRLLSWLKWKVKERNAKNVLYIPVAYKSHERYIITNINVNINTTSMQSSLSL